jgi:hypothetical protein
MAKSGETPPNWLSDIVQHCRNNHRVLKFRQVNCIVGEIAKAKQGQGIKDRPDLKDAIRHGLHAAEERQHEIEMDPKLMTGSPSHEGARVIAERLSIQLS